MDSRLGRRSVVPMMVLAVAGLASCGGGGYVIPPDGNEPSKTQRLQCAGACTASESVAIDRLRHSYVLVNDGKDARVYAAFGTGLDPRANVELTGTDQARVVTPQGTQRFYVLAPSNLGIALVDAFLSLFTGPLPYGADLTQPQAGQALKFEFVRGVNVYTSTVTPPPAFSITAPANNATLPISTRTLEVRLSSTLITEVMVESVNCADSNGNTATSSAKSVTVTSAAGSGSYALDLGPFLDGLTFSTTYPRGILSQCSLTVLARTQADGQPAPGFASTVVLAQQLRRVTLTLR